MFDALYWFSHCQKPDSELLRKAFAFAFGFVGLLLLYIVEILETFIFYDFETLLGI